MNHGLNWMEKRAVARADALTTISEWNTDEAWRVFGSDRDDIESISNPVGSTFRVAPAGEFAPGGAELVVVCVGRRE
jgi:hypothetical protein